MVKTRHLNRPLLERLTTPDQSARSGALTLSDQDSVGHSDPLQVPSLLARLNEPPRAPTPSRTDGAGSRPLLERTAGPYTPVPSLLARFSAPPQAPARLENDEADSRLLFKDFRQALHRGLTPSPRSSRDSNPAHGYRAKRKTPPSGFTTPKSAKRTRTLTERLTSQSEAQPLDALKRSETTTTTQDQTQRVRTTPQPRNDDSRNPTCLGRSTPV